ncbi:nuclease [Pseudorhodoferax sp. Leaf274]|nr:nuclease [Pseudorhodoferax sp. Leaf274]
MRRLPAALSIALPLGLLALAAPAGAAVVISQVYGGGGNSGATLKNDFIEVFNNGSAPADIGGWSVQYTSAAGSSWQVTPIPAGTALQPGRYLLINQAAGSGGTVEVPGDVSGTIMMSGTNGKVALVSNANALSGTAPAGGALVDIVSFGSATPTEGSPTPSLSNTTAALRNAGGCTDTGNNGSDFSIAAPAPRSSATAALVCSGDTGPAQPLAAAIYEIQGNGAKSPLVGRLVRTRGVVTKLMNNGFFMQDQAGDNNPLTSDGIFVFTNQAAFPAAAVGNLVEVTANVAEFNTGAASNADTLARTVTQLSGVGAVNFLNSGFAIAPTVVNLPESVDGDLERYEGMLVTLTGPFTVQQNYFQGRYGQLTLAVGGRIETPTNRFRPGPQANALADENARRRIILDDGSSLQNPNPTPYLGADALPRAGDLTGAITGVIDYGLATNSNTGFGDYKVHPTVAPTFAIANPRTAAPQDVGGTIKVASFNVLNYFTTFTNGATATGQTGQGCTLGSAVSASNCRGAGNIEEFQRQRAKIVEAMAAIDADALGLMEIQNNGNVAAQNLADALNARMGANTYRTTSVPAEGTGTDAIRVAVIYKPARLTAVGPAVSDADPVNNRPTLAQTFSLPGGERFTLFVNHLKSKSSCPAAGDADAAGNTDTGDGQGCWNAQRVQQARRLGMFVAQRQAAAGSNDALLIGDFNAYAQEDPIVQLTGSGFVDQIGRFDASGYSYVFDGAAGRLDHAIASGTLSARVNRAAIWHINADETALADYNLEFKAPQACNGASCPADPYQVSPYRSSDHDPVVIGLNYAKTIQGTAGRDVIVGTAGNDVIIGGAGPDQLTGGGGSNVFVYQSLRDLGDVITDFVPGKDRIDLGALLASIGAGRDAFGFGVVKLVASGADTLLQIDTDGSAGPVAARTLATLQNVNPASIVPSRDLGVQ